MGNRLYRVPYLKFDLLVVHIDHACPELHTDCEVMHGLEACVPEVQVGTGG